MTRARERGFTLMEIVVAMTVFALFLATVFVLTAEMRGYEKRYPVNFHRHPQVINVLNRLRRDILDGHGKRPYRDAHDGFIASEKVLIIESVQPNGAVQTIVWDFRETGVVRRRAYNVGEATDWWARGLPKEFASLRIDALKTGSDAAWATRIVATDEGGRIAIDQILQPRATE